MRSRYINGIVTPRQCFFHNIIAITVNHDLQSSTFPCPSTVPSGNRPVRAATGKREKPGEETDSESDDDLTKDGAPSPKLDFKTESARQNCPPLISPEIREAYRREHANSSSGDKDEDYLPNT